MVKPVKKSVAASIAEAPLWPLDSDSIFNIKIDRETQKFFIDDEDLDYGFFDDFTFRVLDTCSKLIVYDKEFKAANESTLFKWTNEAKDAQGSETLDSEGKKLVSCCGRVFDKSVTEKMTEDQKLSNKEKAKWYTFIFGIAYIPGKNPVLADFRLPGGKQMEVNNILKKIKEDKKEYHRAELRFVAFENKEFDWPEVEVTPDFSRDLPVTGLEPYFDTVSAYIQEHNDKILVKAEKYKKYGAKKFTGTFKKKV